MADAASRESAAWLDSPPALDGRRLRVEFVHFRDRFAHRLCVVQADGTLIPLLESHEGDGDDPWPASPALQALNRDQLQRAAAAGEATVAALVGMSGTTHWSLGIEPAGDASVRGLSFDAAGRVRKTPPQLGSAYRIALEADVALRDGSVQVSMPGANIRIVPDGEAPPRVETADARVSILAKLPEPLPLPGTYRWRYRIELLIAE